MNVYKISVEVQGQRGRVVREVFDLNVARQCAEAIYQTGRVCGVPIVTVAIIEWNTELDISGSGFWCLDGDWTPYPLKVA